MKQAGIAYGFQDEKLFMPPVLWPQRCPCCGTDQVDTFYKLEHKARYSEQARGTTTERTYYELEWQVPYCSACNTHAKPVENLPYFLVAGGLMLVIVFGLAVSDETPALFGAIAGAIVLGLAIYQIALRAVVYPKMKDACAHHGYALYAKSNQEKIIFHFRNDEYGAWFAAINDVALEDEPEGK